MNENVSMDASAYEFKVLVTVDQMLPYFGILADLGHGNTKDEYAELLASMIHNGYRQVILLDKDACVALSGIWVNVKLYCKKYLQMDNVIVKKEYRSKGVGNILCTKIETLAKEEGCNIITLDCYTGNVRAHKFYHAQGYEVKAFHFIKRIAMD